MTAEQLSSSAPERDDIHTSNGFLMEMFDRSLEIMHGKGAEDVAHFGFGDMIKWDGYGARDIEKGFILRNERYDFGLVLGRVPGRQMVTDFEFGQAFRVGRDIDFTSRYLSSLVHQTRATYGSGRFYSDHGVLIIDCWPDLRQFGGDNINSYGQEWILSKGGLEASIYLVQQVLERSWK